VVQRPKPAARVVHPGAWCKGDAPPCTTAASTSTRAPELPNVPTSLDAGYPNSDLTIWYGVFMPSKTAREIVEKFHAAATKVLATPAMQQRLNQLAINPMPMTPADMDKYVVAELSSNEKLIGAAGIK
jgi:tripartite-type tricarboxylate transporter receptor subunit TctC